MSLTRVDLDGHEGEVDTATGRGWRCVFLVARGREGPRSEILVWRRLSGATGCHSTGRANTAIGEGKHRQE